MCLKNWKFSLEAFDKQTKAVELKKTREIPNRITDKLFTCSRGY